MRLFLLANWSQDAYFKFKIHFPTLEDLLCFITENASMLWLLEKIRLSPYACERYGLGSKRNGRSNWFNTCRVEQSRSAEKEQQDLNHQVKSTNPASMLLALPQAQEGQHWHLFEDGSCSTLLCKSIFALILHTEATPPLERGNDLPGEPDSPGNWSCVMIIHLSPHPMYSPAQQLQEIPVSKISPLGSTGIRAKQQTEALQYWKSGWLKNAVNMQISYMFSNSFSPI